MNLFAIAFKSLRQRSLSSILTSLSVALGVMLMVAVMVIYGILSNIFNQQSIGYDLIIGPKGAPATRSQHGLSRQPSDREPAVQLLPRVRKREGIEAAIPLAFGDTTQQGGFPICGTTPEYFEHEFAPRREFKVRGDFLRGHFQAVIGSHVARQNGWNLGSQLQLVHGGGDGHVHDEKFEVVGSAGADRNAERQNGLRGSGRLLLDFRPRQAAGKGIKRERDSTAPPLSAEEWRRKSNILDKKFGHHHEHKPGKPHFHDIAEVQKEVTSILVKSGPKYPLLPPLIHAELKKGYQAQAVNPIIPMRSLMDDILGNVRNILFVLTGLIIVVSGIGIFVSIYNSMAARKKEIAIMRALGGSVRPSSALSSSSP